MNKKIVAVLAVLAACLVLAGLAAACFGIPKRERPFPNNGGRMQMINNGIKKSRMLGMNKEIRQNRMQGMNQEIMERLMEAVQNGDYAEWRRIHEESNLPVKWAELINEENFPLLKELHDAMNAGDFERVKKISEELGIGIGRKGSFGRLGKKNCTDRGFHMGMMGGN